MTNNFLNTLSNNLFLNKEMPVNLSKFLKILDKDIEISDNNNIYNKWQFEILDNDDKIGLKAELILDSIEFKKYFKNNPIFNNSIFTMSISVGNLNEDRTFNIIDKNKDLIYFYNKHQNIILFFFKIFFKTDIFIKSIGIEKFKLINFTLNEFFNIKENLLNQPEDIDYSSDDSGSLYDFESSESEKYSSDTTGDSNVNVDNGNTTNEYGRKYSKVLMSVTVFSPELNTDINFSINSVINKTK